MAVRATLNISVTRQLERFIDSRVASGRYQSASQVVREGLRLLKQRESVRKAALDEVRSKIAIGLEQAKRGELLDGEQVFREIEGRITKRRNRAK